MKINPRLTAFNLKKLFIITCISISLSSFSVCNAQSSVVGKWKEVSIKQFYRPEYAKEMGKAFVEGKAPGGSTFQWEFKADHSYVVEGGRGKNNTTTGKWSISGNQLIMNAAVQVRKGAGAQVYTFEITGNRMTRTMIMQPPYNEIVIKEEDTSVRM